MQYGERERPELRLSDRLITAQVAHAPRTVIASNSMRVKMTQPFRSGRSNSAD
jgi:hypothetical protein